MTHDVIKYPPHSEESERAVLAAVLMDRRALEVALERLDEGSWFRDRHREVWRSVARLHGAGKTVDLRTVQAELERTDRLDAAGGVAYLAGLDLDLPDLGRVDAYVEIVADRAVRREAVAAAHRVLEEASGAESAAELAAGAEAVFRALATRTSRLGARRIEDVASEALLRVEDGEGHLVGIPTGLAELDRIIHGLGAGRLIVIAGRPGMGKSALALNILQHVALRERRPAAIVSLEMSAEELAYRVLCSEADVPFDRLRGRHLSDKQWTRLVAAARSLQGAPLRVEDDPGAGLRDIVALARQLRRDGELDVLAVDYLQLLEEPGFRGNRTLEIGTMTRRLKLLAKELDIPILLLSQLSRESDRRGGGDHRPRLPDLRDSGSIEQDADLVVFVHREEVYNPDDPELEGLAELIIAKHRNGETGTAEVAFRGPTTTFQPLAQRPLRWTPPQPAGPTPTPADEPDPF